MTRDEAPTGRRPPRRAVTTATAVVALVLVALAGLSLAMVTSVRHAQARTEQLTDSVAVWRDVQQSFAGMAYAEAGYRRAPSEQARLRLETAIDAVPAAMARAREVGDARDGTTLSYLDVLNDRYVDEVRRTLDRPPTGGADDRVAGPALDAMAEVVAGAVDGHRAQATAAREAQARTATLVAWVTPLATFAGAALVGLCWSRLVRSHGRLQVRAEEDARRATHDPLTGLANRDGLQTAFAAMAVPGSRGALLMVDLDRFKLVNDTLGHQAGDALLVAVAEQMAAAVRTGDVVARLGGDEFAVLLTSPSGAERVAEKVVAALAELALAYDVDVGASVGTATWPDDGQSWTELVAAADVGLYAAKRAGRGRVRPGRSPALSDPAHLAGAGFPLVR